MVDLQTDVEEVMLNEELYKQQLYEYGSCWAVGGTYYYFLNSFLNKIKVEVLHGMRYSRNFARK